MIRSREGFVSVVGKLLKKIWTNYSIDSIYAADGFRLEFGNNVIWCAIFHDEHVDSSYMHFVLTHNHEADGYPIFLTSVRLVKGNKPSLANTTVVDWNALAGENDFAFFVSEMIQDMVYEDVTRSLYYGGRSQPYCELTTYFPDLPSSWEDERLSYFSV